MPLQNLLTTHNSPRIEKEEELKEKKRSEFFSKLRMYPLPRQTNARDPDDAREQEQRQNSDSEEDESECLRCPISRCVFLDPVMVAGSGNTYERKSIETFFGKLKRAGMTLRDPMTNEPLNNHTLITNWERRRAVQKYLEKLQQQMLQVSR